MQQYFIEEETSVGQNVQLNKEQAHHITNVMRMREFERIRIVDTQEQMFFAKVQFKEKAVFAQIEETIEDRTRTNVTITLAQGLIKGEKWDYLLQKSAELGVSKLVPFTSSRCVVKTKDEKQDKKLARWNKILLEACEQCKRSTLVELVAPTTLSELSEHRSQLNLLAYEDADVSSERLCDILMSHRNITSVTIVIGCEGGFSKEEVVQLEQSGFLRVSLGARILRAETAALSLVNTTAFFYDMQGESL